AGDHPVAAAAGHHHVAEVRVVEVDGVDGRRVGGEGDLAGLAARGGVVLAHGDELLAGRIPGDALEAAVAAPPVEAARLQRAAAAHDLHAVALVDVHTGLERAVGVDAALSGHGDRRAEVAGVVRPVEGDAAVVRVLGPDEDDVAVARRAGAVGG